MSLAKGSRGKTLAETLTEPEVVDLIRTGQGEMSQREYAALIGISAPYLGDIYNGKRSPGRKILKYFGLSKERQIVVKYRFLKAA
jgi:helix-turn-helix protein